MLSGKCILFCIILLTPVGNYRDISEAPPSPVLATGIRFTVCVVNIFLGSHVSCSWTPVVEPFADLIFEHCLWWWYLTFLRVLLSCQSLLSVIVCVSRSVVSNSGTPWTVTHQTPLSMGFLQAGILEWVAIPFLPTEGSNPGLLLCRQILYHLSHQGSWSGGTWQLYIMTIICNPYINYLWTSGTRTMGRSFRVCVPVSLMLSSPYPFVCCAKLFPL